MKGTAQGIWMDSWPDANYGDAEHRITVVPPHPDTDMPDMSNILYDNEAVTVDDDPTSETYGWAMTQFDPITITGDVFVIYSGFYDFETASYNTDAAGNLDLDMMQCDPAPINFLQATTGYLMIRLTQIQINLNGQWVKCIRSVEIGR